MSASPRADRSNVRNDRGPAEGRRLRFSYANVDVEFFDHGGGKVRALVRAIHDENTLARLSVAYLSTVLASWKAGERVVMSDTAPSWLTDLDTLAAILCEHGFLDPDQRIPQATWTRRFEPAKAKLIAKLERDKAAQQRRRDRNNGPAASARVSADGPLT